MTDVMMVGCTVLRGWVVNVWTDGIEVGIGVCWLDRVGRLLSPRSRRLVVFMGSLGVCSIRFACAFAGILVGEHCYFSGCGF